MNRIRKISLASVSILLSSILTFLLLNFLSNVFASQLFGQDRFPRSWLSSVGYLYHTLYPETHDGASERWTAILGDSYAAGAGDAYLTGERKYNLAHYLRDLKPENFLVFGRSGYGNMHATRELLVTSGEISNAWFLPDLAAPREILFLFYEGNDLTDNLKHLRSKNFNNGQVRPFVTDEVTQPSGFKRKLDYYLPLVRFVYVRSIEAYSLLVSAMRRENAEITASLNGGEVNNAAINSFRLDEARAGDETIEVSIALQSAATELGREELDLSLDVFLECLEFLSLNFHDSRISVVYIPSPVTIYEWNDPIEIETYVYSERKYTTKQKNDEYSEYIRSEVAAFAAEKNIVFIDSTEALQEAAQTRALHGRIDWKHLSADGYRLLSHVVHEERQK